MLGAYGPWAASLAQDPPAFSFRHEAWTDVEVWRPLARQRLLERLASPYSGGTPDVTIHRRFIYDGTRPTAHNGFEQQPRPLLYPGRDGTSRAKAGAGEQYLCRFYPGPHKFDLEMQAAAFDWFDRWLKE